MGYRRRFTSEGLNREPIDALPNFTGSLLVSSARRGAPRRGVLRRDRFSEAEHLVLVSTTLPRESIIPGKDRW